MAEKTVLERAAAGERAAWTELTNEYGGMLRAVAWQLRLPSSDAEDATQMTWLALCESLGSIRDPESLGAWLGVVMRRRGLALLRSRRQEALAYDPEMWDRVEQPDTSRPEVPAELAALLWRLVDDLPARERTVVRALFDGSNRSYRQLSEDLDMPVGAIGPVRMRALRRLAARVAEAGVDPETSAAIA